MEPQEYPIRHFEEMARLATALRDLPAQVMDHEYSYEAFGSWSTIVRVKGVRLRVIFDGKEEEYSLQRSLSREPPDDWCDQTVLRSNTCTPIPIPEVLAAVASACD